MGEGSSRRVKEEFLEKWMEGLRKWRCFNPNMSFLQRKQAIKLSADLAMASTRSRATRWSRALIISHGYGCYNKLLLLREQRRVVKRCRRVVKRKKKKGMLKAKCIAKRLVEKRKRMLKRVVPGGEFMDDDVSLIEETLDYIQSLRAQVQVMRSIASSVSYNN